MNVDENSGQSMEPDCSSSDNIQSQVDVDSGIETMEVEDTESQAASNRQDIKRKRVCTPIKIHLFNLTRRS